ncbi:MAG: GTPase [Candidatus Lokiarchaeota archaeon]|nr:GTPase [Candidatus Lokiarchaeota archaeon]
MTKFYYFVGTAGSGKSFLTAAFMQWLEVNSTENTNIITVNFDPGVLNLSYSPDVDCRDYIDIYDIMEKYELGPNGGLIASIDLLISSKLNTIKDEIEEYGPDIVLIDTPGQLELFAFRSASNIIIDSLDNERKNSILLFLNDPSLVKTVGGFISSQLLALNVYYRSLIPIINVLSKSDLLSETEIEKITSWSDDEMYIEECINIETIGSFREISLRLQQSINEMGVLPSIIPISALNDVGLHQLYAEISRILTGGEDFSESY